MSLLKIAICQHKLSSNIQDNLVAAKKQVIYAAENKAGLVHFPECNLTGYAGIEFLEYSAKDNHQIENAIQELGTLASRYGLYILAGGYWFEDGADLPYNSMFVINPGGNLEGRYDKRLLTAGDSGDDINYFVPGSEPFIFTVNGIRCGVLICHEWRYPELYREYKGLGIELIFQSWYDANLDPEEYSRSGKDHGSLIIGSVRSNAANNYMWISGSNASNRESSFGSFLIQPDGHMKKRLPRNRSGILNVEVDTSLRFIDPSRHNRERFYT